MKVRHITEYAYFTCREDSSLPFLSSVAAAALAADAAVLLLLTAAATQPAGKPAVGKPLAGCFLLAGPPGKAPGHRCCIRSCNSGPCEGAAPGLHKGPHCSIFLWIPQPLSALNVTYRVWVSA